MSALNSAIDSALDDAIGRYTEKNPKSHEQHELAAKTLPGGNTRSVLFVDPFPISLVEGEGSHLLSLDGDRYVDFLGDYTAGLFGHSDPIIRKAIDRALDSGISRGGHSSLEATFGDIICQRFPSIERVRFTNSGTEANLMAISTARAVTGRQKIMVFDGAYHGGVFMFESDSPINAPFDFIRVPYNDTDKAVEIAAKHANDLAAIVVEPMLGAGGCITARRSFLAALRETADKHGALLIFDEVMTSRLAPGGMQEVHNIFADLTTLGKYIGGGMSFGAFGGRADIMSRFDPREPNALAHAGTFNNNVLTMSAGIAGLSEVYTPKVANELNARGEALRARLNKLASDADVLMQFTGYGSMMTVHMSQEKLERPQASDKDAQLKKLFYFDLINDGVWIARRGMITVSLPIGEAEMGKLEASVGEFVSSRKTLLY